MQRNSLIIFLIISVCLILPKGFALDFELDKKVSSEIKLYLGEVQYLSVSNPTRIAIANPKILDVTKATKDQITLNPKAQGKTTLVIWDDFGEQSYQISVFTEDINLAKDRIDKLLDKLNLPGVYIHAEEEEGKVFLLGRVKSSQDKERINLVLGPLRNKTVDLIVVQEEEAVVEIDVQVLELSEDAQKTLGFQWPSSTGNLTEPTGFKKTLSGLPDAFFRVSEWTRSALTAKVDFLVTEGKARILSRPRLACQSGKEAKLLVGGEVPVFTATVTTAGTTGEVEYKEHGIILNIKPTVDEFRRVHLNLGVEVSELGTVETTTYARAYPLTKRNAYTELILDNGQTLAIGGLIKQKSENDIQKLPWLGDIPILGAFFRKKTTSLGGGTGQAGDIELFITLTPTIVSEPEPPTQLTLEKGKQVIEFKPLEQQALPLQLKNYIRAVQTKITDSLYYPLEAKYASWEGILKLSLVLSSDGSLKDVSISQSSGYKTLDDAGLEAVKSTAPFPAIPKELNLGELRIEIPIVYHKD